STRFTKDGVFVRVDGEEIANEWTDLASNNYYMMGPGTYLTSALNLDENGNTRDAEVWTGTYYAGTFTGNDCNGWTSAAAEISSVLYGSSSNTSSPWTFYSSGTCDQMRA